MEEMGEGAREGVWGWNREGIGGGTRRRVGVRVEQRRSRILTVTLEVIDC